MPTKYTFDRVPAHYYYYCHLSAVCAARAGQIGNIIFRTHSITPEIAILEMVCLNFYNVYISRFQSCAWHINL